MNKPNTKEYNPYFNQYIDLVPEGEYLNIFENNTNEIVQFFESIPEEKENYCYAQGKWSIKQVLMHIIDTERVFAYRLLVIIRKDELMPLYPFSENLYAASLHVEKKPLKDIIEEFKAVRMSTYFLLKNTNETESKLSKDIGDYPMSVRAIAYLLLGHALHHKNVVEERYF